jgi:non-heme chloroperoxidase
MPYFENDDVRLFYKDWGTGRPVVFLASAGMSSDFWQYQLVDLSERGLRCIA